jgi:peptide/nickel transport system permease protein
MPVPIFVIGTAGTAGGIRSLRAVIMDELGKQYVVTARAKGVGELRLLFKYPIRLALNPWASGVGGFFVGLISGEALTSIVLSLPTVGPLMLTSLLQQDLQLAASLLLFTFALGLIGTLMSDLILVLVDPRIRFEKRQT